MPLKNDDIKLIQAIQAMQNNLKLRARAVGKINVCRYQRLTRRRRGMKPRRDIPTITRRFTDLEKRYLFNNFWPSRKTISFPDLCT